MVKWDCLILTCASKNSSMAYQKELKLKQEKGIIDSETLIICVEDPEKPIGSGGATLNALLIVAETLSARNKHRMTQVEVLKDTYILIMHMGRHYSFDVVAKGMSTLPLVDNSTGYLLNNFDLLYYAMSYQVACFDDMNSSFKSDPGVYVCSTDMIFLMPKSERLLIKNKPICVIASLAEANVAQKNGIYELNETKDKVKNIHFQPDENVLARIERTNGLFNLVSGIVYFDYEVTDRLFTLLTYSPMDACSYIGIDSGASPLCLSIFFDILLSCCQGVTKEDYLSGSFKTNHTVEANQRAVLRQARATLWQTMHAFRPIDIITVGRVKHVYMDNDTFEHRRRLFVDVDKDFGDLRQFDHSTCRQRSLNVLSENESSIECNDPNGCVLVNVLLDRTLLNIDKDAIIVNSSFNGSKLTIGENTYLSDLNLSAVTRKIPPNVFVQSVCLKLESLNVDINVNVVFGINDNLTAKFDDAEWTIMNEKWTSFATRTSINETDLWPSSSGVERTLSTAKLYPIFSLHLSKHEMEHLSSYFWLDLILEKKTETATKSSGSSDVEKWRHSMRLSLDELNAHVNLDAVLTRRRWIFDSVSTRSLVDAIVRNRPIQFGSLIRHVVRDGFAERLLDLLDEAAFKHIHDLILLPRIMIFQSNIMCEMASSTHSIVRSGPSLNSNWLHAFACIEANRIEQALVELSKTRRNWMHRDDMLIRAARHYEGAMLAFIRLATSCFKLDNAQSSRIKLNRISDKTTDEKRSQFEWVIAESPARLDLAGAWSDTPPITYECVGGSCVTNVAILVDGRKPIGAKCRRVASSGPPPRYIKVVMKESDDDDATSATTLVFTRLDELADYNRPKALACLMKACLVFTRLVEIDESAASLDEQLNDKLDGCSIELHTWTGLPHGSGLGTSSILIGCVLKALWRLMHIEVTNESLSYSILVVEQIMTTNGGWQDQVGSIWGGFKLTTAKNQLPLEISVRQLNVEARVLDSINKRLILVYTGITRLAKDLLLNVLRNWYGISRNIYDNVQELVKNGFRCAEAIETGDIAELGACISRHRAQKLVMAPESEPDSVKHLMSLLEPHVYGLAMAGAGGGGFVYALTKTANNRAEIERLIEIAGLNMRIYSAEISNDGIELTFS